MVENRDKLHDLVQGLAEEQQAYLRLFVSMIGSELASYVAKEIDSVEDWSRYCHCVGGLLLQAQCRLLCLELSEGSNEEKESVRLRQLKLLESHFGQELIHSVGLLVTKAESIVRFPGDVKGGFVRWPKEIVSAHLGRIEELSDGMLDGKGLSCWNAICSDALCHAENALELLEQLSLPRPDDDSENVIAGENGVDLLVFFGVPVAGALRILSESYNSHTAAWQPPKWSAKQRKIVRHSLWFPFRCHVVSSSLSFSHWLFLSLLSILDRGTGNLPLAAERSCSTEGYWCY